MKYLLDTDFCIDLLRGRVPSAVSRLRRLAVGDAGISTITLAELSWGAARSARPDYHRRMILRFCAPLAILPFDSPAAETYGEVRHALERIGTPIGSLDMLIASHALAHGWTLVTSNTREFRRIPGLRLENWRGA